MKPILKKHIRHHRAVELLQEKSATTKLTPCLKPHLGTIQLREANGVHDYIKERTIKIGKYVVEEIGRAHV